MQKPKITETVVRLQQELQTLRAISGYNNEVLSAVVSLVGEEAVRAEMLRLREEQKKAEEQRGIDSVNSLIEGKVLTTAESITEGTLVVGKEELNGSTNRIQFEVKKEVVPAELFPKLIGKKVGDTVENNNSKMQITEIYQIDKEALIRYQTQQKVKATEVKPAEEAKPAETT